MCIIILHSSCTVVLTILKFALPKVLSRYCLAFVCYSQMNTSGNQVHFLSFSRNIRVSVDALCRDGAGLISRERVQRGRLTRQRTTS